MNRELRAELLAMQAADVSMRERLAESGELDDREYHPEMKSVHETNNRRMMQLVRERGWPRASEVGEDGAEAAWLIVQHAVLEPAFQEACIPLLEDAVDRGEASAWHLAYLQDRVLVQQGKRQIYGTQHEVIDGKMVPAPTLEPERVDARRAALGLWSQAEHTAHLQRDFDAIRQNREKNTR